MPTYTHETNKQTTISSLSRWMAFTIRQIDFSLPRGRIATSRYDRGPIFFFSCLKLLFFSERAFTKLIDRQKKKEKRKRKNPKVEKTIRDMPNVVLSYGILFYHHHLFSPIVSAFSNTHRVRV